MASAEHVLIGKISPFLDAHMMFPLLTFLDGLKIFNPDHLLKAKLDILDATNMLDYMTDLMGTEPTPELLRRREVVVATLVQLKEASVPLLNLLEPREVEIQVRKSKNKTNADGSKNPESNNEENLSEDGTGALDNEEEFELETQVVTTTLAAQLKEEGNFRLSYLEAHHGVTADVLTAFAQYGKFQYECGNYEEAASYMDVYRQLDPSSELSLTALWGKLASEILMMQWDENAVLEALVDLNELILQVNSRDSAPINPRDAGAVRVINHLEQLQFRSWILHWGLFVYFNHPEGRTLLIESFMQQRHMNAIQTNCPHLLRYLAVAVVTTKANRSILYEVVRIIEQERNTFTDPITDFLFLLYSNYDFEGALAKLEECEKAFKADYFLANLYTEFMEIARQYAFEVYARVHTAIDTKLLCSKLGMAPEDAERWIVDLIRNSKMIDAKIDSERGQVVMAYDHPEVYRQVIDSTKDLTLRSHQLANDIFTMQNEGTM